MKTMFWLIEKVFCALVVIPPVYIAYRFIKWYLKPKKESEPT